MPSTESSPGRPQIPVSPKKQTPCRRNRWSAWPGLRPMGPQQPTSWFLQLQEKGLTILSLFHHLESTFLSQVRVECQIVFFLWPRLSISCIDYPVLYSYHHQYQIIPLFTFRALRDTHIPYRIPIIPSPPPPISKMYPKDSKSWTVTSCCSKRKKRSSNGVES